MSTVLKSPPANTAAARRALLAERLRQSASRPATAPLSSAQERLWFLDQLEPDSALYNLPTLVRIEGPLVIAALEKALVTLVERHESLRTRIVEEETGPLQAIDKVAEFRLGYRDLSTLPDGEGEKAARALVQQEIRRPFALSRESLIRGLLIQLRANEHFLLINIHHIICDEWSLRIFFRELNELYGRFLEGTLPSLPPLHLQYGDYAAWQRDWLRGEAVQRQLEYWKTQLSGCEGMTEWPLDKPRMAEPTFTGSTCTLHLGEKIEPEVEALAERTGCTTYMVLLATLKTLIHRCTQQEDIIVGSPFACRTRPETENLIGFFVNTLPLKTNLAGDPTFAELLLRVKETVLEATANQEVPLDRIVDKVRPQRSLDHMPFTRLVFLTQQPVLESSAKGLKLTVEEVEWETAKFDLTFAIKRTAAGLALAVEYNTDLFQRDTISRLSRHFQTLLTAVLAEPGQKLSQLPLLTPSELREMLESWNATATAYSRNQTVHRLFEAQAARTPAAMAVTYGAQSLTYEELNARANQLAHYLRRFPVGRDIPVAICVSRSVEMVIGLLAILKSGSAYVPLDPNYPKERLLFMLKDTSSPVLLTQQELVSKLPRDESKPICLDGDWELIARESRENPDAPGTAEDLAYVMYTSGSTGKPKGVAVPHRAVNRLVLNTNYIQLDSTDRLAQVSNVSFDAATFEIWGALLNGGQLVGITRDVALSPVEFAKELKEQQITAMFLTAAIFHQLASEVPGAFETVKTLMAGGEALDPKWVREILTDRPPKRILNGYGPTENTTFTCCHEVMSLAESATNVPIGRPIANTQVYILDRHLKPVPVGVQGELYAGGDGLARGYWNRPELTREKFVPNPFLEFGGSERLYRTGDLARYLPDGTIEFLGRIDDQVKVRGFRIELGEIEAVLSKHPGVRECVVAARGNSTRYKKLVAYFVPQTRSTPNATALRTYLEQKLPDYMVPAAFVRLAALPLTPNGKVNRQALPEPNQARPELERKYASPRDAVELKLTRIWEEVLGVKPVGIEDKFFELGGHSLLAVRVIAQIEKVFGRKLRVATIFHAPTVEQLAAVLREEIKEGSITAGTSVVEIQSQGTKTPLFLVHGAGGGMFWGYVNLSRHLGTDQPVYGFKSQGMDGTPEPGTIEELAAQYVADLRKVQPGGPYRLGGYCFGGNVAYEMARQLESQGEKVDFVALLNCAPPNSRYTQVRVDPAWLLRLARNLLYWTSYVKSWTPSQRREFFRWKWALLTKRLRLRRDSQADLSGIDVRDLVDLSSYTPEQQKVWESHIRALLQYHPKPFQGRVLLFRSPGHPLWCSFDPDYGWSSLAQSGVQVTVVPGAHEKILEEPCVADLAKALLRCFDAVSPTSKAEAAEPEQSPVDQLPEGPSGCAPATGESAKTSGASNGMTLFTGLVAHATLFWLNGNGEVWQVDSATLEHQGLQLCTMLEHLGIFGAGVRRQARSNAKAPVAEPAGNCSGTPSETSSPDDPSCLRSARLALSYQVPPALVEQMRELCSECGVQLRTGLAAVVKVVLVRSSSFADSTPMLIPGLPAAGPNELTGFKCAVHEIIAGTELSPETTFRQLLLQLAQGESGTAEDSDLSLLQINSSCDAASNSKALHLRFGIKSAPQAPTFELESDEADFSAGEKFLGHLERLLTAVLQGPDLPVAKLAFLSAEERETLLHTWNNTARTEVLDRSFLTEFSRTVSRVPQAVAARWQAQEITYRELDEQSSRLAHILRDRGVQPEVVVAVCLERSLELLVTLLAVWKAGGAYLPLDPAYPADRLNYMLSDSGAKLLVTRGRLAQLSSAQAKTLLLEQLPELASAISEAPPSSSAASDSLAYIIYTSGSTGTPKGVQITHRSLLNHNLAVIDAYGLKPGDRVLQFSALSFDISVEEIFPTLLGGATLVFRPDEALSSIEKLLSFAHAERISVMNLPTAYWHELVETMSGSPGLPGSLRLVVIGGERASAQAYQRWKAQAPGGVRLINTYGPTETTVIATLFEAGPNDNELPIGKPIQNVQTVVLDQNLEPVPIGATGELFIGGAGLSRGYLNRPELTAEKFIANPGLEIPTSRLYRTGDLVRYRADGNLEFVGRVDQQIKVRGYRVELGEIEAVLRSNPSVKEALVIAQKDGSPVTRLLAYYVPRPGESLPSKELRLWLSARLPEYMIPAAFVQLPEFPLTPAGKLDRRSLPQPDNTRPELEQPYVSPRTALEESLAKIWAEILGVDRVGVYDNFFELGGHSLLATRIMSRVREMFHRDVTLANVFELPTIAALAEKLAEDAADSESALPPAALDSSRRIQLSPGQKRTWFLDLFDPRQASFNLVQGIKLTGSLEQSALDKACRLIAEKHPILRTVFPIENGEPVGYVCDSELIRLRVLDLTRYPEGEKLRRALSAAREEARRTCVVSRPMFRPLLLQLSETEHWLLVILHEVGADAESLGMICGELVELYGTLAAGKNVELQPGELFSPAEIEAARKAEDLAYWRQQLAGAPEALDLPSDYARPAHRADEGDQVPFQLDPELANAVRQYATRAGVTPQVVLLTAWHTLLHRYTGLEDILVGSLVSKRSEGTARTISQLTNNVALRCKPRGGTSFEEAVKATAQTWSEALAHGHTEFGSVLDELKIKRNASYTPLFQVMFNYWIEHFARTETAGLLFEPFRINNRTSKCDLALWLYEGRFGIEGVLEYSPELFCAERIQRAIGHFTTLLRAALSQPQTPLARLPLLSPAEVNLLAAWNATEREFPRGWTLPDLFHQQALKSPEAEAVVSGNFRLSYREFDARVRGLASHLRQLGIGPESLVGICLERSWEMIAAIMAVLDAGGAYVPMDPNYPQERLEFMVHDARAQVLISQRKLRHRLPESGTKLLLVDDLDWEELTKQTSGDELASAKPENLAYVIYTSGSTGVPKGVAIEHRSAVAFVSWARETFAPEDLKGVLAATSICFDLSIYEMFVPLCSGGKVILAENALALASLPAREEVTLVNTVPSAIRELLRLKAIPASVRVVNLAGEPLPTPLVDRIYSETAVNRVFDLYGPTETTTYSTFTLRRAGEPATIGVPLANEQVYILDRNLQLLPIGVPGELFIGGIGLAREYLRRPELTGERFIPNPFQAGTRLYRTGDLARWRADGCLEYLGRIDHQVKIRGFRVELGEIETRLKQLPGVQDAVVMAREDQPGDKRLTAYLVLTGSEVLSDEQLRKGLRAHLPDYMVPSFFIRLPALPLTPNGKVDRKALPAPVPAAANPAQTRAETLTATEQQLLRIWSDVLGGNHFSVRDSFFDVGGHSLLAVQVISRVRESFAVELPLFSLFDAPTIELLAKEIDSDRWRPNASVPKDSLRRVSREQPLRASYVQERLWVLEQVNPGTDAYHVPTALRLSGKLDRHALEQALVGLVDRHEVLRTTIQNQDGTLFQTIASQLSIPVEYRDFSAEGQAAENASAAWLQAAVRQPFDLEKGPLLRIRLADFSDSDHVIAVVLHHAIADGWSLHIFFKELAELYDAALAGRTPNLPPLPVQVADVAAWEKEKLSGEWLETELAFWKQALTGARDSVALPSDSDAEDASPGQSRVVAQFGADLGEKVAHLCQREGLTPYMVFMSGLAATLHAWTDQSDMVLGTVVAGRNRRELEGLIGCFMNFLPIRLQLNPQASVRELLKETKTRLLEAQAHQECPFERIVEAVNPQRKLNQNPLYNVALVFQNFPGEAFHSEHLVAKPAEIGQETPLLDLRLEIEPRGKEFRVLCEYRPGLFMPSTMQAFVQSLSSVLHGICDHVNDVVSQLPVTDELKNQATLSRHPKQQTVVALSATFTAEPVEDALAFWFKQLKVPVEIAFAPYNQVLQELLDPRSLLSSNAQGLNVVLLRLEDWKRAGATLDRQEFRNSLATRATEFVAALKTATERSTTPHLVLTCPASKGVAEDPELSGIVSQAEEDLEKNIQPLAGAYFVSSRELANLYPVPDYYDQSSDELGHVPYTPLFFTALGTLIARKFHALKRGPYKVVALDCDQTIWSGVCGEDGANGIRLDHIRQELQAFMRRQFEAGMLLCLCSKNNEEDVYAVFDQRREMPLTREHLAAVRLNWEPKSRNLQALAQELGLGLDSFIFVDDNPVECAEVQANCPEVLTLLLPENPELIPGFLKHCWAFDRLKVTAEDRKRSESYRQNSQREQLRARSSSLGDFLASLDLKVEIAPMAPGDLARVAQLTQRTNQFNFTTTRRAESELQKLAGHSEILTIHVSDRFGDYGLVGVVIFKAQGEFLDVDTFLLSCRVLGRGVEHRILARLGEIAKERGLTWVDAHFVSSPKNKSALDFLQTVGNAYRQPLNGGWVFRFPAAVAAEITLNPQNPPEAVEPPSGTQTTKPAGPAPIKPGGRFDSCRAIALDCLDLSKLHDRIGAKPARVVRSTSEFRAPKSDLERQLCELWATLLKLDKVGIDDDFFAIGGHSLLAVRLFAEIEKLTGRKLPLVTLFQAPTIAKLAALLEEQTGQGAPSLLVPIQPLGSKTPLFLVHGAGGDVLWGYANLAAHLGSEQPLYGIKSRGQIGLDEFHTIEEMAAAYVKEIRAFWPEEPYLLGGYCFGGNVAYEMARQLRMSGQEVAAVVLFDSAPANAGYERVTWWQPTYSLRFLKNAGYWLDDFRQLKSRERTVFVKRKIRATARKVSHRLLHRNGNGQAVDLDEVIDVSHFPERELKLWQIHLKGLVEHVERRYEGRVVLLRTRGQPIFCSLENDFGWRKVARNLTVKLVPGSHEQVFMEPHVRTLARELHKCLEAAIGQGSQAPVSAPH